MVYSKVRQPKLSDVIEQQLETLILEGTLRPGRNSFLNESLLSNLMFPVLHCEKLFSD
ncbi:Pyruvate dehydrogenase complex repressor [Budvicia aquatica]|uniref:Pyruvate dehydrogenase complex repressor n=1 Tax=Budvicia aquatica TaxID=82979 RepID=A0A484ZJV9_9GAMM|nr:Pyruvate dehydrogenase complex repressor [Budvicia aquatica]